MTRDEIDSAINRLSDAIDLAQMESTPCENIYMEQVFPTTVYAEILRRLPKDSALNFLDHTDAVTPDGRRTRKVLDLNGKTLRRFDERDRAFWSKMLEILASDRILASLVNKFRKTFEHRFGHNLPDMIAVPLFYRDYPGYRIGIHPDIASKLITLQFYLPNDDSQIHLGTTFHRKTGDKFEEIKTNAFRPNSAYAFARTDESWHSVRELGSHEHIRNSIALTIYIRGHEFRSAPAL